MISSFRNDSYASGVLLPAAAAARALRTSPVCGKEPIVVVGSSGRPSAPSCAAARTSAAEREKSAGTSAAVRARTACWVVPANWRAAGDGLGGGGQLGGDPGAVGQPAGEHRHLGDLLVGEGQPFGQVGRQVRLGGDVVRDVQQRGGGGGDRFGRRVPGAQVGGGTRARPGRRRGRCARCCGRPRRRRRSACRTWRPRPAPGRAGGGRGPGRRGRPRRRRRPASAGPRPGSASDPGGAVAGGDQQRRAAVRVAARGGHRRLGQLPVYPLGNPAGAASAAPRSVASAGSSSCTHSAPASASWPRIPW